MQLRSMFRAALWTSLCVWLFNSSPSAVGAEHPASFKVSTLSFTRPAAWEWVETTSSMRKAQLRVPDPKGKEAAEIVFFHFGPNNGGGTQANVDRWFRQFQEPREQINAKTETAEVAGTKITYVQAQGTYLSGMPGGPQTPKSNFALVGAIVEAEGGSIFVRLTGPKESAAALVPDFKKMVESGLKR